MPERSELAKAIVAAADREFSSFKDAIGGALEQRFKDKIDAISKEKAAKIFNPDWEPVAEEPDEELESSEEQEEEEQEEPEEEETEEEEEGEAEEEEPDEESDEDK